MNNKRKFDEIQLSNSEMTLNSSDINNNTKNAINRVLSNKIILNHIFYMMRDLHPKNLAKIDTNVDKFTGKTSIQQICFVDVNRFTQINDNITQSTHKRMPIHSLINSCKYKDICYFDWMVRNGCYSLLFEKLARNEVVLFDKTDGLQLLSCYDGNDLDLLFKLYRIFASAEYMNIPMNKIQNVLCEPIIPILARLKGTMNHINNEILLNFFYVEQKFKLHPGDIKYCFKSKNYQLLELIWKYQQLTNQEQLYILAEGISNGLETVKMLFRMIPMIFWFFSTNPYTIDMNKSTFKKYNDTDYKYEDNFHKLQTGNLLYEILNFGDIDLVRSIKERFGLFIQVNALQCYINSDENRNDILELCFTSFRDQITSTHQSNNLAINDIITNYGFQINNRYTVSSTKVISPSFNRPSMPRFKVPPQPVNSSTLTTPTLPLAPSLNPLPSSLSFAPPMTSTSSTTIGNPTPSSLFTMSTSPTLVNTPSFSLTPTLPLAPSLNPLPSSLSFAPSTTSTSSTTIGNASVNPPSRNPRFKIPAQTNNSSKSSTTIGSESVNPPPGKPKFKKIAAQTKNSTTPTLPLAPSMNPLPSLPSFAPTMTSTSSTTIGSASVNPPPANPRYKIAAPTNNSITSTTSTILSSSFTMSTPTLFYIPPSPQTTILNIQMPQFSPQHSFFSEVYRYNLEFKESMDENEKQQFMSTNYQLVMSNQIPFIPHSNSQLPIIRYIYNTQLQLTQPHITLLVSAYNGLLETFIFIINHHRFLEYLSTFNISHNVLVEELFLFSISNRSYDIIQYLVSKQPFSNRLIYDDILYQCILQIGELITLDIAQLLHPVLTSKHASLLCKYAFKVGNSDLLKYIILNYRDAHIDSLDPHTRLNSSTIIIYLDNLQYLSDIHQSTFILNTIIQMLFRENNTGLLGIFIQEKYRKHLKSFIQPFDLKILKKNNQMKMLNLLSTSFPSIEYSSEKENEESFKFIKVDANSINL